MADEQGKQAPAGEQPAATPPAAATPPDDGKAPQTPAATPEADKAPVKEGAPPAEGKPAPDDVKNTSKEEPKPGEKKDEAKGEEPPPKPPGAPDKYELKLPENTLLDKKALQRLEAVARENDLTNDEAQAIVNQHSESFANAVKEQSEEWRNQVLNDREIGGDDAKRSFALAQRMVEKHGPPELKAELEKFGYGNHPSFVKFCVRLGKAMGEDVYVQAEPTVPTADERAEAVLYPSLRETK
jgi:hypothetical protein